MRDALLSCGITLVPDFANGHEQYAREGHGAQQAWNAFREIALEPAYGPVRAPWGETVTVSNGGFTFEGGFSPGWPASVPGDRDVPEHYELNITRQFELGEAGSLRGLRLTIFVPATDELRSLEATLFGGEGDAADIREWLDEVEADPAFRIPMTRHSPERFAFGVVTIG